MTALYQVIVRKRQVQAEHVVVLELVSATEHPLPKVEAGAHIDLHLPNGLVRQYSLCQNPLQTGMFRLGILKDPASRGGSISAFEQISEGMQLNISAPKNLFPLQQADHSVLIGGGIGITPLLSMAYQLLAEQASFELHYCAKSALSCAFVDELQQTALANHTHFHFKDDGGQHREFLQHRFKTLDPQSHIYTCGPQPFMDWVIHLSQQHGVPDAHIHKEFFQLETDLSGECFEVVAQRSGKIIMVNAEESIVAALARAGIMVDMSCEQGVCGTCMCDVIEGIPDHRDVYFTDEEKADNEQIILCCSRSKTPRLVLDI